VSPRAITLLRALPLCLALALSLGFLGLHTRWRGQALDQAQRLVRPGVSDKDAPPRLIHPQFADGYLWVRQAQDMARQGRPRVHYTDYDNAPAGRQVHWASGFAWWLIALGALHRAATGAPIDRAIDAMAPYANPILLALVLIASALAVARRRGPWAGAAVAVGWVSPFLLFESFLAGYPDHHGVIAATCLGMVLCLQAGGGGLVRAGEEARARRYFMAAGVLSGLGLWTSALSMSMVLAASGAGALLSCAVFGREGSRTLDPDTGAAAEDWDPDLYRLWGRVGALTSFGLYLLEYFPSDMGMHLEVNHPLYALALLGGGELLAHAQRAMLGRGWPRGWQWAGVAAAALAVLALPLAVRVGGARWYGLLHPFMWHLHSFVYECRPAALIFGAPSLRWLYSAGPQPLLIPLALLLIFYRHRGLDIPRALRARLLLALVPSVLIFGLFLWQVRWASLWECMLVGLSVPCAEAVVRLGGRGPLPRWAGGAAWAALLALCLALYPVEELRTARRTAARGILSKDEAVAVIVRDISQQLRARGGEITVLSSPLHSLLISHFTGGRALGTFYWENLEGLQAAAAFYGETDDGRARDALLRRGVTHLVLLSERDFLAEYCSLQMGRLDVTACERTLAYRLSYTDDPPPPWLRRVPYKNPFPQLARLRLLVRIYEVVPPR
jgi:hypothetical protein